MGKRLLGSNASTDKLNHSLGGLAIPNTCRDVSIEICWGNSNKEHTITSNHEELIIICQLVDCHIGVCGDNLLFGRELRALLEFKVTDGTGQGKVAIDTTKVDETAGCSNTSLLACEDYLIRGDRNLGSQSCSHALTLVLGLVVE